MMNSPGLLDYPPPPSPRPAGMLHGMDASTYLSWRRFHLSKAKLSNVAEMASFMAGFSVVATVELQISDERKTYNPALLIAFSVTTAVLVATSMLTVMITTCILPELDAINKISKCPSKDIARSPHDALTYFVNVSWILANTVSLFLFTLDVIFLCWIQFEFFSQVACWAATGIMVPVLLLIIIFGILFYRELIEHKYDLYSRRYEHILRMQANLERGLGSDARANSISPPPDFTTESELYNGMTFVTSVYSDSGIDAHGYNSSSSSGIIHA